MISLDGLLLGKEGFYIDLLIMSITDSDNSELFKSQTSASSVRNLAASKTASQERDAGLAEVGLPIFYAQCDAFCGAVQFSGLHRFLFFFLLYMSQQENRQTN